MDDDFCKMDLPKIFKKLFLKKQLIIKAKFFPYVLQKKRSKEFSFLRDETTAY